MKWTRQPHKAWGKGGTEERVHEIIKDKNMFPGWQYISENKRFSILPPSGASFGSWELMDFETNEVERFSTLKQAKEYAESR